MSLIDKIKIEPKKREKLKTALRLIKTILYLIIIFAISFYLIYIEQGCRAAWERMGFFVILILIGFWRLGEKRTQPLWLLPYLVFILFGTFILAYDMYEVCYGILKQ